MVCPLTMVFALYIKLRCFAGKMQHELQHKIVSFEGSEIQASCNFLSSNGLGYVNTIAAIGIFHRLEAMMLCASNSWTEPGSSCWNFLILQNFEKYYCPVPNCKSFWLSKYIVFAMYTDIYVTKIMYKDLNNLQFIRTYRILLAPPHKGKIEHLAHCTDTGSWSHEMWQAGINN